jgi:hypothetical protein
MILPRGKMQHIPPKRHNYLPHYTVLYPRMSTENNGVSGNKTMPN